MIYLAADHAGFRLKEEIKKYLKSKKISLEDLGTFSEDSVDFPDYAVRLVKKLRRNDRGILFCGTGLGMSMAANRFKKIRAAFCFNEKLAQQAREHSDCNVLVLAGWLTSIKKAKKIVDVFFRTKFLAKEKYNRRIRKLEKYGS